MVLVAQTGDQVWWGSESLIEATWKLIGIGPAHAGSLVGWPVLWEAASQAIPGPPLEGLSQADPFSLAPFPPFLASSILECSTHTIIYKLVLGRKACG